ncbi:MAG TPA: alpha/beta hydrolase [Kofleriaceae bacterium]|nr:alpha/beta hydrolase [Kofleriaceae bacterium]
MRRGVGRPALLVHGAAADLATWTLQLHGLDDSFTLVAYDRRVGQGITTEDHADDAAALLAREFGGAPALVIGSSYGGVIALELACRAPDRVAALVLCEPPLPPGELVAPAPFGYGCHFDRLTATAGGERAGEMFLRSVLGDAGFAAIPGRYRRDLCAMWPQIRSDMYSLGSYRVDHRRLAGVAQPVLLLAGDRSPPFLATCLDALAAILPGARRAVIPGAGHAMHIDNHRAFRAAVLAFAAALPAR